MKYKEDDKEAIDDITQHVLLIIFKREKYRDD